MQVILLKDVKGTGKKGDIVKVADGFGKNFLIKNGFAMSCNSENMSAHNQQQQAQKFHKAVELQEAKDLANKLKDFSITLSTKCGENGKIFGSITSKEIADKLHECGFKIDKKKIILSSPIKCIGHYTLTAKIYPEVSTTFNLEVTAE